MKKSMTETRYPEGTTTVAAFRPWRSSWTPVTRSGHHKSRHNTTQSGERGIRTLGTLLGHTRFPSVRLQPLGHLSTKRIQTDTAVYSGEGGIRTHGRGCLHLISSQAPSSTRPPLRIFAFSVSFSIRRRRKNSLSNRLQSSARTPEVTVSR